MGDDPAGTLAWLVENALDDAAPLDGAAEAVLREAARFAARHLAPLAAAMDRPGCTLDEGRVRTAPGHAAAWREYAGDGWAGLTAPEAAGGQALPMALAAAVQEVMDAANPAFGMLGINARCATRLLASHGDAAMRADWMPRLASGEWGATICISEPQAGSDVGRIRARAEQRADGVWTVTGEKCWISYGDHDLTQRIGHFLLARPRGAPEGTRGLSLFLVADRLDDGRRNGVTVARLEEKLGLHGSPTCGLAFEAAEAVPVGLPGRGLATLFAMIISMRLGVASQGAAVAQAACEVAERYAHERAQGGDIAAPPVPISRHAEVRRTLLRMRARAEVARLLALQAAAWVDASDLGAAAASARAALLLPVAKTFCAEAAFTNADAAIGVLGGAGYVKDWPVERMLRDCRVFSIYEGTSAIQALDLLGRRVLGREGDAVLRDVLGRLGASARLAACVLETAGALAGMGGRAREAGALPFLRLVAVTLGEGLLLRAGRAGGERAGRYAALAEFWGRDAVDEAAWLAAQCRGGGVDATFEAVFAESRGE
jgi:alkylation response protein AidB-like acyl-CoA dehydrogenase